MKTRPDVEPKPKLLLTTSHHRSKLNYREDTAVPFLSLSTPSRVTDQQKFSDRDERRPAPLKKYSENQ